MIRAFALAIASVITSDQFVSAVQIPHNQKVETVCHSIPFRSLFNYQADAAGFDRYMSGNLSLSYASGVFCHFTGRKEGLATSFKRFPKIGRQ